MATAALWLAEERLEQEGDVGVHMAQNGKGPPKELFFFFFFFKKSLLVYNPIGGL